MIKQNKTKSIWSIVLITLSVLILIFTNLIDASSLGYLVGSVLIQLVVWGIVIGIIAYGIWRALSKRPSLIFIVAIIFFIAAIGELALHLFQLYMYAQIADLDMQQILGS